MSRALANPPLPGAEVFLHELEPVAAQLLDRHLQKARAWYPHELIRWSAGTDFVPGEPWEPTEASPHPAVRSALHVNLLTEDNLAYYYGDSLDPFGRDRAWGQWRRRWTAEEYRHSEVIRAYLTVHKLIDLRALEDSRMQQMSGGEVPTADHPAEVAAYATFQEPATRVSHKNTGLLTPDNSEGRAVMARVAADENLHYFFYRDVTKAGLEHPDLRSVVVTAIARQIIGFKMPGTGIPDFAAHARRISDSGIYNLDHFLYEVVDPILEKEFDFWNLAELTPEAEEARELLGSRLERLGKVAERERQRRQERHETALANDQPPVILLPRKTA